jgi:hypothetical protein
MIPYTPLPDNEASGTSSSSLLDGLSWPVKGSASLAEGAAETTFNRLPFREKMRESERDEGTGGGTTVMAPGGRIFSDVV